MIEMAREHNRAHAQKVRFIASSLEDADLGDEVYDKVFGVRVAALERSGRSLEVARRVLAPGGSLHLFSQAPGWTARKDAERFGAQLSEVLESSGFTVDAVLVGDAGTGFVAGVAARAAS
jgi:Methyltransferase domain